MFDFYVRKTIIAISLLIATISISSTLASEPEIIFSAQWGDNPGEIGLINQPERERCGPLSFSTDGKNVFMIDSVHKQIVGINAERKARIIKTDINGWCIRADSAGGIFVFDGEKVAHIDTNGKSKEDFNIAKKSEKSSTMVEGYGVELFVDSRGNPTVNDITQNVYSVVDAPELTTFANNKSIPSKQPVKYIVKRMLRNEIRILGLDKEGKELISIPIKTDGGQAGVVLFKGIDLKGNIFVELENIKGKQVNLEVHCYSKKGERLRVIVMPNNYFTTVYKKTEVLQDGSVYQMLTTEEGVKILRWKF